MQALTIALLALEVDARAGDQDIVNDGKAALAAHPAAVLGPNAGIVQDCGLVQQDSPAVDRSGEGDLVRMEVVKA